MQRTPTSSQITRMTTKRMVKRMYMGHLWGPFPCCSPLYALLALPVFYKYFKISISHIVKTLSAGCVRMFFLQELTSSIFLLVILLPSFLFFFSVQGIFTNLFLCRNENGGVKLSLNRWFYDERWSRNRCITCMDWSPQYPELLVTRLEVV